MMKGHYTVSNAFKISSFSMIIGDLRMCSLCAVPCTIIKLSWMDHSCMNALWWMPTSSGKSATRRTERVFANILIAPCTKLTG